MLIGFTGYAGSGKDTAARVLIARGWKRIAIADPIREMTLKVYPHLQPTVQAIGWDKAEQIPDVREALQCVGVAAREAISEDVWLDIVNRKWADTRHPVVVTDVRFDNEAEWVRWHGFVVSVRRPGVGPVNGHASEQGVSPELVDYVIENDGNLGQLHESVLTIAEREFSWRP